MERLAPAATLFMKKYPALGDIEKAVLFPSVEVVPLLSYLLVVELKPALPPIKYRPLLNCANAPDATSSNAITVTILFIMNV